MACQIIQYGIQDGHHSIWTKYYFCILNTIKQAFQDIFQWMNIYDFQWKIHLLLRNSHTGILMTILCKNILMNVKEITVGMYAKL